MERRKGQLINLNCFLAIDSDRGRKEIGLYCRNGNELGQ